MTTTDTLDKVLMAPTIGANASGGHPRLRRVRQSPLRPLSKQPISFLKLSAESAKDRFDVLVSHLFQDSATQRHEHYFYRPAAYLLGECAAMTSTPFVQLVVWPQPLLAATVKTSTEYQPSQPLPGAEPRAASPLLDGHEESDPRLMPPLLERRRQAPRKTGADTPSLVSAVLF